MRSTTSIALRVQRIWRFDLVWVHGGEVLLKDDDEWKMSPWWEPEHPRQPYQHPRYHQLLLPHYLLAPFTENSTQAGIFPVGYYCMVCGRINVQRFLRHRICEGTVCNSRTDPQRETGWVTNAFSTRD
jgi:hypothetical protein